MSGRSKKDMNSKDEEVDNEEISDDEEESSSDEDEVSDKIPEDDSNSEGEEFHEPEEDKSGSSSEEEEEDPAEDEEDDVLPSGEDDDQPEEEEEPIDDEPAKTEGGDDEQVQVFDDGRKKTSTRKKGSRRLFPFVSKKKKSANSEPRDDPEFHHLECVRSTTKDFMSTMMGMSEKEIIVIEKAIFNASVRASEVKKIGSGWSPSEEITSDSIKFKSIYLEIVRYIIGALGGVSILKKGEVVEELRRDLHSWNSAVFSKAREIENKEQSKIKNPLDVMENPNYPCPRCGGIKSFKAKAQLKSGDEGGSLRLWCLSKNKDDTKCGHNWRID